MINATSIRTAYRRFLNTEVGARSYGRFKQALYTDDDSLVQALNNCVLQHLPVVLRDMLSVCDVGGGDGRRIRKILKFLHEKFGVRFRLDFVEQSAYLMREFDPEDIRPFAETRRFEAVFEDVKLPCRYDLVFLIHSIFAFESDAAVEKILSLCNPGGVIVIVANADDSFLAGLKRILDAGYADRRFEINDLLDILRVRGIEGRLTPFETKWAVSTSGLARHTKTVLDWLSLGRVDAIGEGTEDEIRRYISQNSIDVGGRTLFTEREVVVVASP